VHDYGHLGGLPKLNTTTLNSIFPVRAFNIDILVRPNHSTAHAICFPSDGPVEVANVLPTVGSDHRPQVTFLGPRETWRKAQKRYRSLYSIDGVAAYQYLAAWKGLRHPLFAESRADTTASMRALLATEQGAIEGEGITTAPQEIAAMSAHVGDADEEEAAPPDSEIFVQSDLVHAAVLPRPSLIRSCVNAGIQALCEILTPTEETYTEPAIVHVDPVAVSRGPDPPPEWDQHHTLLSDVFAHLFLLGKGLPTGSLTKPHLLHLFRFYDGRFETRYSSRWLSTSFSAMPSSVRRRAQGLLVQRSWRALGRFRIDHIPGAAHMGARQLPVGQGKISQRQGLRNPLDLARRSPTVRLSELRRVQS
jgi:hypothetical protein